MAFRILCLEAQWRTVSSDSSQHSQKVRLAQLSLYNAESVPVFIHSVAIPSLCLNSVKRSDVTGKRFEWLLGENNVIQVPPPIQLLGENIAGHGY